MLTTLGVGLRAGPGERAGRRLFSAISFAVVGDGCAVVSDGVAIAFVGEGFSVGKGDATNEGVDGVSEGCAPGEVVTEGEVSARGVSVAAGATVGLAAGVSLGDGPGVCKGAGLFAGVSAGDGATASVGCGVAVSVDGGATTVRGLVFATRFPAGASSSIAKVKSFRSPIALTNARIPSSSPPL